MVTRRRTFGAGQQGFTVIELAVSAALVSVTMACVFAVVVPAREAFTVQPEAADVQQRLRVAVATLTKDLLMAGAGRTGEAGCTDALGAALRPYRIGEAGSDAAAGTFYRPDVVSVVFDTRPLTASTSAIVSRTYYLKQAAAGSPQLMRYDGLGTDHPVLEDVVVLAFEYFGVPAASAPSISADPVLLEPEVLTDGPWCPDPASPERFDADLLRIRRVGVRLRVQAPAAFRGPAGLLFLRGGTGRAPATVPDQEIRFDVAPRSMNGDR